MKTVTAASHRATCLAAMNRSLVSRRGRPSPLGRAAVPYLGGFGPACETIQGLWRGLAAELGPWGVRLICLRSAGSPDTPDVQETFRRHAKAAGVTLEKFLADAGSGALLGRLPMKAEVANVAAMLASDRASAMTGTFVNVTCGSRAD